MHRCSEHPRVVLRIGQREQELAALHLVYRGREVEGQQGAFQVEGGLFIGEDAHGQLRRAGAKDNGALHVAARRSLEVMVGEFGDMGLTLHTVRSLEEFGYASVQSNTLRRSDLFVKGLPDRVSPKILRAVAACDGGL